MRRIAHTLAVAAAVVGLCLTAAPAGASTGAAHPSAHRLTAAQRRALAAAKLLQAQRAGHGVITGLVREPDGAPAPDVCVVASGPLGTRKTFTRPDGTFLLAGLRTGAYRVEYRGCSPIAAITGQYYGGTTRATAAKVLVTGAAPVRLGPVRLSTLGSLAARRSRLSRPASLPRRGSPRSGLMALSPLQRSELLAGDLASGRSMRPAGRHYARVSGRVRTASGRPLRGVCVLASLAGRGYGGGLTRTSADGRYTLILGSGRYYIAFLPTCAKHGNFAPQAWKAAGSIAKATVVGVRPGHRVKGIDATLSTGAQITGRVRTHAPSAHHSLAGVCLLALGTKGQRLFEGFTTTSADGSYTLGSLATGTYRLLVNPYCGRSPVWLPASRPLLVKVTDGSVTKAATTWVKPAGAISGVVRDSHGRPLGGICVNANSQTLGAGTLTMANGTYRIPGLAAGRYQIDAEPGCGNNGPYATVVLPDLVTVHPGAVTAHVNVVLPLDGALAGVVKDAQGNPLGGICVQAQGQGYSYGFATTKPDGSYTLKKLSPGSYQVQFIPGGVFGCGGTGNYLPVTDSATVTSQATTTLDAVLPAGGTISGTVTGPHGQPLSGVCVFSDSQYGGQTISGADGSYRLDQMFSGSYYVGFEGGCGNQGSVAPQAYLGDPTFYGPASIAVTQGAVTTGIDARMKPGATITGRITDQAGHAVSGVCVSLTPETGAGADGTFGAGVVARHGSFSAANLPPGQYDVLYSGLFRRHRGCGRSPYADRQFSNQGAGATPDLIYARGGKITSGADAALPMAGQISGVVTDRSGRVLPNMCVQAIGKSGAGTTGFTGRHGRYTLRALAPGRYKVEFTSCGGDFVFFGQTGLNYASQWYRNKPTARSATVVTVRQATTTGGIDGALPRGGSVSGQVTYRPDGRPVSFVCVFAYTGSSPVPSFGLTDRRGHYLVDGLSTGRYTVEFTPCSGESALAGQLKADVRVTAWRGTAESASPCRSAARSPA